MICNSSLYVLLVVSLNLISLKLFNCCSIFDRKIVEDITTEPGWIWQKTQLELENILNPPSQIKSPVIFEVQGGNETWVALCGSNMNNITNPNPRTSNDMANCMLLIFDAVPLRQTILKPHTRARAENAIIFQGSTDFPILGDNSTYVAFKLDIDTNQIKLTSGYRDTYNGDFVWNRQVVLADSWLDYQANNLVRINRVANIYFSSKDYAYWKIHHSNEFDRSYDCQTSSDYVTSPSFPNNYPNRFRLDLDSTVYPIEIALISLPEDQAAQGFQLTFDTVAFEESYGSCGYDYFQFVPVETVNGSSVDTLQVFSTASPFSTINGYNSRICNTCGESESDCVNLTAGDVWFLDNLKTFKVLFMSDILNNDLGFKFSVDYICDDGESFTCATASTTAPVITSATSTTEDYQYGIISTPNCDPLNNNPTQLQELTQLCRLTNLQIENWELSFNISVIDTRNEPSSILVLKPEPNGKKSMYPYIGFKANSYTLEIKFHKTCSTENNTVLLPDSDDPNVINIGDPPLDNPWENFFLGPNRRGEIIPVVRRVKLFFAANNNNTLIVLIDDNEIYRQSNFLATSDQCKDEFLTDIPILSSYPTIFDSTVVANATVSNIYYGPWTETIQFPVSDTTTTQIITTTSSLTEVNGILGFIRESY